jgi:arsenite/tail-anchored protein-transporting ATPase
MQTLKSQLMIGIPEFLTTAPRHLFFTGKGGVGKTSLACASVVLLADKGRRVLLVSTDPASNLDAVLGTELTTSPTPVAGVSNLQAMNIDPEAATEIPQIGEVKELLAKRFTPSFFSM